MTCHVQDGIIVPLSLSFVGVENMGECLRCGVRVVLANYRFT